MSQGKYNQKAARSGAEKKGPARHTVVFYTMYVVWVGLFALLMLALAVGVLLFKGKLDDFLMSVEAAQPNSRSKEVFEQYFADPDWEEIYALAEVENAEFDSVESFVQLMQQQAGGKEMSFTETSMGLSADKKFIVRAGEERVAAFILHNETPEENIPTWVLLDVEVYYTTDCHVTVTVSTDCTVTVNGKPLDEGYVVSTTTISDGLMEYVPEGTRVDGVRTYYVDGLMVAPEVKATDGSGTEVTLQYDEAASAYTQELEADTITDEQLEALDNATQIYGRFMIADVGKNTLAKYFKGNSYNTITQAELTWVQGFASYAFEDLTVTDYRSFTDTYFAAYFQRNLNVTRKNGTVKPNEIMFTCFMEKQNGKWIVVDVSNANVLKDTQTTVRLRFMQDGKVLEDQLLDSKTKALVTPMVEVPQGKKLVGWATQSVSEEGKTVMTVVFQPGEFGDVSVGEELKPMVLYPVFEKEAP